MDFSVSFQKFSKSLIFHAISIEIHEKSINIGVPIKLTYWANSLWKSTGLFASRSLRWGVSPGSSICQCSTCEFVAARFKLPLQLAASSLLVPSTCLGHRASTETSSVEVLDALSDALDEDGPAAPILKHVCTELVVRLGRHHDAAFQPLVRAWGKRATAPLCNALSEAFEPLFVAGS